MLRLTIDAAEKLRQKYATIDDLSQAAGIATATAGNARSRRGIGSTTVGKIAKLLGENPDNIITWLTPDEETIRSLRSEVESLKAQIQESL